MKNLKDWYNKNIGKILLLSIILTFFTVTVKLVPYFNFLFSGQLGFPVVVLAWYWLFSPSTKLLVIIAWVVLPIAFLSENFQIYTISNQVGDFLYLNLLLIFVNYIKDFVKNRNNI